MKFNQIDKNHTSLHDIKMRHLFKSVHYFWLQFWFHFRVHLRLKCITSLIGLVGLISLPQRAVAATQLIGLDDETLVYSGPSYNYRLVYVLKAETSLALAKDLVKTKDGIFYKVLVIFKDGRRAIGYIPQSANVRIKTDAMDDEDFTKYSELGLSKNSISTAFSYYRGDSYMVTLGYQKYRLPGFYTKYYFGEWIAQTSSGHHLGFELGNDALLSKQVSGFIAYAGGLLFPAKDDAVFLGSKTAGLNYLLRGAVGLKFNQSGGLAFSLGATQSVLFNPNNSYVSFGAQASIEVGI